MLEAAGRRHVINTATPITNQPRYLTTHGKLCWIHKGVSQEDIDTRDKSQIDVGVAGL